MNEALHQDATGRLADTPFLRKLGPIFIADCFRVAHQYDSNARLIYNENKVCYRLSQRCVEALQ